MKVLHYPRDRNPYQNSLIRSLRQQGVSAEYLAERSGSHTLNLLMVPVELTVARARGFRVLHVHWLFRFSLPQADRLPVLRHLGRAWLTVSLGVCRLLGVKVVWTAHNVLPHHQIFPDDEEARHHLLRKCSGVIAHAEATLPQLRAHGWRLPDVTSVIRPGPLESVTVHLGDQPMRARLGIDPSVRVLGTIGRLEGYKGVLELVDAATALSEEGAWPAECWLVLAGECLDPALRKRLQAAAAGHPRIVLDLRHLEESDFVGYLKALDVLVLPFRAITSSGSAIAALNAGVPVLVPAEPDLDDLPQECLIRYQNLTDGLRWVSTIPAAQLTGLAERANIWSRTWTWEDVGIRTAAVYTQVLAGAARPTVDACPGKVIVSERVCRDQA